MLFKEELVEMVVNKQLSMSACPRKRIPGFPNYSASTTGKIFRNGNELSPATNDDGYLTVVLYKDGKPYHRYVHNLIATAWLPNPEGTADEANHKDGDKTNCAASNLRWATGSDNTQHAYDKGLAHGPKGEINGKAKLDKGQVSSIRKSDKSGEDLASKYDVDPSTISLIKNNKRW